MQAREYGHNSKQRMYFLRSAKVFGMSLDTPGGLRIWKKPQAYQKSTPSGLLMKRDLHSIFDQYLFSINPDACTLRRLCILGIPARAYWHDIGRLYKIVSFAPDENGIDGHVLEPACRDPTNPNRISNEFLRWHFHQSVLANMRGSGEPIFETDFPPGTDQIKTLASEPYGKKRFKMEMGMRLRCLARDEQVGSSD